MARTYARGIPSTLAIAAVLTLAACVAPSPTPAQSPGAAETTDGGRSIEIAPGRTLWMAEGRVGVIGEGRSDSVELSLSQAPTEDWGQSHRSLIYWLIQTKE